MVSPKIIKRLGNKAFGVTKFSKFKTPSPILIDFIDLIKNPMINIISRAPTINAATCAVQGAFMIV